MTVCRILVQREQAVFIQVRQATACIGAHPAVARLGRRLLRARDAAGSVDLYFSPEFPGRMLGVRRHAVSVVAGTLQENIPSASSGVKFEYSLPN